MALAFHSIMDVDGERKWLKAILLGYQHVLGTVRGVADALAQARLRCTSLAPPAGGEQAGPR